MNKIKINMIGGGFQHDICSSHGSTPLYVEWVKDKSANISIHIDRGLWLPVDKIKKNYGWLHESSAIIKDLISWVHNNIPYLEENFECIFTHDRKILSLSDKFRFVPPNGAPWIKNHNLYKKTKLLSAIASTKNMCEGHAFRNSFIEKHSSSMDVYGRGRNYIVNKEGGLKDYAFSVAIMNANYFEYFTEIVTDCFSTGTIPIFWGTTAINRYFNEKGIIYIDNYFDIKNLSMDLYYSKIEAVKDNLLRVKDYPIEEDYIYLNIIK
jgi:hypothetical protein